MCTGGTGIAGIPESLIFTLSVLADRYKRTMRNNARSCMEEEESEDDEDEAVEINTTKPRTLLDNLDNQLRAFNGQASETQVGLHCLAWSLVTILTQRSIFFPGPCYASGGGDVGHRS